MKSSVKFFSKLQELKVVHFTTYTVTLGRLILYTQFFLPMPAFLKSNLTQICLHDYYINIHVQLLISKMSKTRI